MMPVLILGDYNSQLQAAQESVDLKTDESFNFQTGFNDLSEATLLGLTIESSLSFDCHVENLCNRLTSHIGVLSEIRAFLSLKQRLVFYNAIICPVMSCADVIWSSCDKDLLYRVFKLQKRAARIILFADHLVPSDIFQ